MIHMHKVSILKQTANLIPSSNHDQIDGSALKPEKQSTLKNFLKSLEKSAELKSDRVPSMDQRNWHFRALVPMSLLFLSDVGVWWS